jgi:hypothetical protein
MYWARELLPVPVSPERMASRCSPIIQPDLACIRSSSSRSRPIRPILFFMATAFVMDPAMEERRRFTFDRARRAGTALAKPLRVSITTGSKSMMSLPSSTVVSHTRTFCLARGCVMRRAARLTAWPRTVWSLRLLFPMMPVNTVPVATPMATPRARRQRLISRAAFKAKLASDSWE